jgi:VIT1/CCC1 family predicted Fe2+/Mn2+ transporter
MARAIICPINGPRRAASAKVRGMTGDAFPEADRAYLVDRVADSTGMSREKAEARVTEVLQSLSEAKAEAQQAAEKAREAAVTLAVITFVSLLVGAFIGAVAAALGGSHRDDIPERVVAVR